MRIYNVKTYRLLTTISVHSNINNKSKLIKNLYCFCQIFIIERSLLNKSVNRNKQHCIIKNKNFENK